MASIRVPRFTCTVFTGREGLQFISNGRAIESGRLAFDLEKRGAL